MKKPKLTAVGGKGVPESQTSEQFYKALELDVFGRTLWGEARGEGSAGMQAVANVVLNRVKFAARQNGFWWGNNIIQVCQKPFQFSCWNRSDPNFQKLQALDKSDLYFATALRISARAISGTLEDITYGATHYHAAGMSPYWAKGLQPSATIGRHIFYTII